MAARRIPHIFALFLCLTAFTLTLTACNLDTPVRTVSASVVEAMGAPADESYARAFEPRALMFPLDHGPHPEYRTEWWYYTGNLTGADGAPYGYQLTFFRNALSPQMPSRAATLATNQVYMAHFALTDGGRGEHHSFDRYSRGAGELAGATGEPAFQVWLEDWSAAEVEPGVMRLQAAAAADAGPVAIDLTLRATRPPVLHGEEALHQKGPEPGNASYYYSLVGLETTGVITPAGAPVAVTGLSWMDHEFGTSALSENAVGWDWFSIQLEDGTALMLYEIRAADGGVLPYVEGTLLWPDGRQEKLSEDDFTLSPTGSWTSPTTGITYPAGWEIELPAREISLTVTPLVADQELDVSFVYWEGAVDVAGTVRGAPARGRGYVELTGYGEQSRAYQR
jgi:predicted secreted hydrolase